MYMLFYCIVCSFCGMLLFYNFLPMYSVNPSYYFFMSCHTCILYFIATLPNLSYYFNCPYLLNTAMHFHGTLYSSVPF